MTIFLQNYQKILPPFGSYQEFFSDFVFYSPPFPPQKGGTCPPPGGPKTTHPSAETWLIPLPVADPTPTYNRGATSEKLLLLPIRCRR